ECDSAARPLLHQRRAELRGDLRKSPVTIVMMQQLALAVMLQLRIDMPVGHEQIDPSVVVVIKEPSSPADIRHAYRGDIRFIRNIREGIVAVVVIERVVIVHEVSFKNVEAPVMIVIADSYTHTSLLAAVRAERRARDEADLLECSVSIVMVKQTRR